LLFFGLVDCWRVGVSFIDEVFLLIHLGVVVSLGLHHEVLAVLGQSQVLVVN
jgi:hypothetical protein